MENNINEEQQNMSSDVQNNNTNKSKRNKVIRVIGLIIGLIMCYGAFALLPHNPLLSALLVIWGIEFINLGKKDYKGMNVGEGIGCMLIIILSVPLWVLYHILFKWLILEWVDKNF